MLVTKMDIKYINKAIDYVENVQGYTAVIIKEKKFCETYVINATYGNTDEWYQLEVNIKIGGEPEIVNSKKM